LEGKIRDLARVLELDGTVSVVGYREDALRVAGIFDVFALSSIHEGLPIALIEAMSLGVPAVVTGVGGNSEVLEDGRQGYIVPARDPIGLAESIVTILRDPALRKRLGESARQRAADFDIRKSVRRTEQIYEELLR
jgi:glycosyltransferase involved in cell wall biosynthesis